MKVTSADIHLKDPIFDVNTRKGTLSYLDWVES